MLALTPEGNIKVFTDQANNKAQSVVYLASKEKIIASISIADVIRPESKQAVEELNKTGIEVAMLTAGVLANWGILLSPAVGALLMSISTIVVALNAQLLRRVQL